jgi:hypothetical protein
MRYPPLGGAGCKEVIGDLGDGLADRITTVAAPSYGVGSRLTMPRAAPASVAIEHSEAAGETVSVLPMASNRSQHGAAPGGPVEHAEERHLAAEQNRAPRCSLSCSSPTSGAVRRSPHKRVTCASGRLRTASESGQRTLNPRVRGSSPWRRTRPELAVFTFPYPGRWPFPGHVCSTFARQSGLSRPAGQHAGETPSEGYTQRDAVGNAQLEARGRCGRSQSCSSVRSQTVVSGGSMPPSSGSLASITAR